MRGLESLRLQLSSDLKLVSFRACQRMQGYETAGLQSSQISGACETEQHLACCCIQGLWCLLAALSRDGCCRHGPLLHQGWPGHPCFSSSYVQV